MGGIAQPSAWRGVHRWKPYLMSFKVFFEENKVECLLYLVSNMAYGLLEGC